MWWAETPVDVKPLAGLVLVEQLKIANPEALNFRNRCENGNNKNKTVYKNMHRFLSKIMKFTSFCNNHIVSTSGWDNLLYSWSRDGSQLLNCIFVSYIVYSHQIVGWVSHVNHIQQIRVSEHTISTVEVGAFEFQVEAESLAKHRHTLWLAIVDEAIRTFAHFRKHSGSQFVVRSFASKGSQCWRLKVCIINTCWVFHVQNPFCLSQSRVNFLVHDNIVFVELFAEF